MGRTRRKSIPDEQQGEEHFCNRHCYFVFSIGSDTFFWLISIFSEKIRKKGKEKEKAIVIDDDSEEEDGNAMKLKLD